MKRRANPYGNTRKRKAALAWLAERGITQPRALYPQVRQPPAPCVDALGAPEIVTKFRGVRICDAVRIHQMTAASR